MTLQHTGYFYKISRAESTLEKERVRETSNVSTDLKFPSRLHFQNIAKSPWHSVVDLFLLHFLSSSSPLSSLSVASSPASAFGGSREIGVQQVFRFGGKAGSPTRLGVGRMPLSAGQDRKKKAAADDQHSMDRNPCALYRGHPSHTSQIHQA